MEGLERAALLLVTLTNSKSLSLCVFVCGAGV